LGIRNVGLKTSLDLAFTFKSIEELKEASIERLESISDVGPVVAQSIYDWFQLKENREFLKRLKERGVSYFIEKRGGKLLGKTFVITGTLEKMSRDVAKEKIVSLGGEVSGAVSKNTGYLILGENPGLKHERAKALGVKILKEEDFLKMIS
jgi:DNA ligase (NAD+)